MEHDVECHDAITEKLQLRPHKSFQFRRGIHVQTFCASEQRKSGNQADEPETMVAVKMRNENMGETAEADTHPAHLNLGTFPKIWFRREKLRCVVLSCCCVPSPQSIMKSFS